MISQADRGEIALIESHHSEQSTRRVVVAIIRQSTIGRIHSDALILCEVRRARLKRKGEFTSEQRIVRCRTSLLHALHQVPAIQRIKLALDFVPVKVKWLANHVGATERQIQYWKTEERMPSMEYVEKVSTAFGMTMDEFWATDRSFRDIEVDFHSRQAVRELVVSRSGIP